ncbi:MAG: type II toxin-antitoxin system PemK/MazF family toxin [Defluviitaleaceae bacterium]|nr:type II toxin-antitoxin system PemK/MazF family toxin [Defluviitaleaceae bacterium]
MVRQGDIIFLDFDPQAGSEQAGVRPALVVSTNKYHFVTSKRAIVCPITRSDRKLPIHIRLDGRTETKGFIMCDQIKTVDLVARGFEFVEKAPSDIVDRVLDVLAEFIGI